MSSDLPVSPNDRRLSEWRHGGRLVVFSAPSGGGKSTIIRRIMEDPGGFSYSVSSTTRPRRAGERDGVDYDFITREEFETALETGDFLEHEEVHGHLYGTRKSLVEKALMEGRDLVFDLDVLGALSLKEFYPEAMLIYIDVPSVEELRHRLLLRGREDEAEIELRLKRYRFEREHASSFDRIVVNDDLDRTVEEVRGILREFREDVPAVNKDGGGLESRDVSG